jgi:hypothetical protein
VFRGLYYWFFFSSGVYLGAVQGSLLVLFLFRGDLRAVGVQGSLLVVLLLFRGVP